VTRGALDEQVADFAHLEIRYDDRVLRPRPWTAAQSLWGAELLRSAPEGPVLELCCGAGQIGLLTIVHEPRRLICVDLNPVAAHYTRRNAVGAGVSELVEVREGAITDVLRADERFALVVADPPWVRRSETGRFPEDPLLAIDGGDDGLDIARMCVDAAAAHLLPGGSALLQLGSTDQADLVGEASGDLRLTEVREYDGGVVARLDRAEGAS
jgi:methylase of polypeptide subunit release factors